MNRIHYNALVLREPYSGVEVVVHGQIAALAEYGTLEYTVHLPARQRPLPEAAHMRYRTVKSWSRLLRILREQLLLPLSLKRSQAALLHAPAYVAPLWTPCPLIVSIHDLHVFSHPQFCTPANRWHYRYMIPRALRRARAVVVYSAYVKQQLLHHFPWLNADEIHLIPPGIDPFFKPVDAPERLQAARRRYRLPERFLLFVGDLTLRKNALNLLQALAVIREHEPECHLVLAGAARHQELCSLRERIKYLGLADWVSLPGYIAQEDLPSLYTLAAALLFPTHDEGFGLPPLEALACGTPVVCAGEASRENCAAAALYCDPDAPESIAAAALKLLQEPSLRQTLLTAAVQRLEHFSRQKSCAALERLYREVLAGS